MALRYSMRWKALRRVRGTFRTSVAIVVLAALAALIGLSGSAVAAEAPSIPATPVAPAGSGADDSLRLPSAGDPRVQHALSMIRGGDAEGGMAMLRAAVVANPELSRAQVILAQYLSVSNQSQLARAALEQAVVEDPADPEAYVILGDIAVRERRLTESLLLYGKALELVGAAKGAGTRMAAMRTRAASGAGQLAESRRDWKAAQGYWEALASADPKQVAARQAVARALLHQGKPEAAFAKLQEAAAMESAAGAQDAALPEAAMAQLYHERAKMAAPDGKRAGLSQQQQEDERQAGEWLVMAITKAPADLKTRLYAAQWAMDIAPWYGAKKLDEAVKQAQNALKIDAGSLSAKLVLAQVAMMRRDYPAAEKLLMEAHAAAPSNAAILRLLAVALAEQPDAAKKRLAAEYAQLAYRASGDHPEGSFPIAWTLYRLGRMDEAEQALAPAVSSSNRPSPDAVFLLARILADRGRKPEAYRVLERGSADLAIGTMYLMREAAAELLKELAPPTSPK